MIVPQGLGGGENRELFNGLEFQFCKMRKFWRSVTQHCVYT